MKAYVVDTNVGVVANGKNEQADCDCIIACISALQEIYDKGIIVIDDADRIFSEYRKHLCLSGQPGPGDMFAKWVYQVQADERRCECIHLTEDETHPCGFLEAPNDPDLAKFDRSDTKFVAVSNASKHSPLVLNAVDSDWQEHYTPLTRNGIKIRFLCPQHLCPRNS
ncbi:MAG: hypothetical protein ACYC1M_12620 [Armatimonadota bacterium]